MAGPQASRDMMAAQHRMRIEHQLQEMAKKAQGDMDYEMIDRMAEQYGVRAPWHPDFQQQDQAEVPQQKQVPQAMPPNYPPNVLSNPNGMMGGQGGAQPNALSRRY
jgi:hypothetical protein